MGDAVQLHVLLVPGSLGMTTSHSPACWVQAAGVMEGSTMRSRKCWGCGRFSAEVAQFLRVLA